MASGGKTTSQKHRDFVREPMVDCPVTDVPGIGDAIGCNFNKTGINFAKDLYAKFLVDRRSFKGLIEEHGGNSKQQNDAYKAMKEWDNQHN